MGSSARAPSSFVPAEEGATDLDRARALVLEGANREELAAALGFGSRRSLLRALNADADLRAAIERAEKDRSQETTDAIQGRREVVVTVYRLARVISLAADGMSLDQIGREVFDVSPKVFREARGEDDRLEAAISEGRAQEESYLVSRLLEFTKGDDRAALTAIIFALKARHNHVDRGGFVEGRGEGVRINITLPAASPNVEAYEKVVEATPKGVAVIEASGG